MDPDNPEESQTDESLRDTDKMYRESAVLAPDLDVQDDDVVDVGAMRSGLFPSMQSGFFPVATEGKSQALSSSKTKDALEPEPEPESGADGESAASGDDGVAVGAAETAPIPGYRTDRIPIESSRSWSERVLVGLLVANTIVIGAMLFVPGLFQSPTPPIVAGLGDPPSPNLRPVPAGRPVDRTHGGKPAAISETMPDYEVYESAQHWIGRGYYDKATRILESYLNVQSGLSTFHSQVVHSSLAYCAGRLGKTDRADAHFAMVENFRRLAANPEDLWAEADQARTDGRAGEMRQICARLLLKQDDLQEWTGTGRIAAVRIGIGDSYRIESKALPQRPRVVR